MIREQHWISFGASYQKYGKEISNSTIVDDDNSVEVQAMYMYLF